LIVRIADEAVDSKDPFLFHKTTNRWVYDRARMNVSAGEDEVILWNERGEVTEATTANVVVEIQGVDRDEQKGMRVTPPVACGLLAGTFRAEVLARGEVSEAIVTVDQLKQARRIWLINSVHEWREARLQDLRSTI
jgi:para-aminobenzoate synthetase/4-amino-4-deoxychorismate lyase